nr:EamA family transporter [Propionibacterium sp.]
MAPRRPGFGIGLAWALVSAASFGFSGTLASGLITAGWTPALAVTLRITIGALALLLPTVRALRGRWTLLRANAGVIGLYGLLAVALPQTCFFFAVQRLPVGPALLIEYVSPLVVLGWWWLRHRQTPTRLMVAGSVVAMTGLLLVLGITTPEPLDLVGVLWAASGTIGAAAFFLLSARPDTGLPPIVLAGDGLVTGGALLGVLGLAGVLPLAAGAATVGYGGAAVPAWGALLALGLVAGALAYSAGIAASRRLGSRLASFVGLSEVVLAFGYAWLLLGQVPRWTQVLGALLILAGVTLIKLGEPGPRPPCADGGGIVGGRP